MAKTIPILAEWRAKFGHQALPDTKEWLEANGLNADSATAALAQMLAWPFLRLSEFRHCTLRLDLVSYSEAIQRGLIVVALDNGETAILCANPFGETALAWVETRLGALTRRYLVSTGDLRAYLARVEEGLRAADTLAQTEEFGDDAEQEGLTLASIAADSPVIQRVNSTLYDAWRAEASDVHIEATSSGLRIRYRLDGVLTDVSRLSGVELAEQVISRIKVMAELDIAERRVPQDGRFKLRIKDQSTDFRVSIMPSIYGEDAVLRLLDKRAIAKHVDRLTLVSLGFDAPTRSAIDQLAAEPHGMLLVTGPTGSGKSTTLYAVVEALDRVRDKIVTIEDPVEYQLSNALQIPVNERKGLSFARGLRSILRHDPDTILVGEIRDSETAQIAVQAALTGHLVLTSVHANHTFDVIGRLMHMGVDSHNFVSALNGVVAQRLVRTNCPECSAEAATPRSLTEELKNYPTISLPVRYKEGHGCAHCRGTGFKGRQAIAEVLLVDDDTREQIMRRESVRQLKIFARSKGMQSLREAALARVCLGQTSLSEINRITSSSSHA